MAITDINISEQLETSAPSIKYEGNEGPQSPQEQQMAQLKKEYMQYVFEQKDLQQPVMSFEEWYRAVYEASKMGVDAGQQLQQPQGEMMRQPVAYGGIMGLGGRRRYGFGSKLKKKIRNIIPNEVADIAVKAAPFVAPFNPAIAGLMSGIGGFDQHGSISKGLKSGLLTYGGGQLARGIGGAGPQWGLKGAGTGSGLGSYFTSPTSGAQLFGAKPEITGASGLDKAAMTSNKAYTPPGESIGTTVTDKIVKAAVDTKTPKGLWNTIKKFGLDNKAILGILGTSAAAGWYTKKHPGDVSSKVKRGEGLDLESIRTEVIEAFKDPTGEKLKAIRIKYPFLGAKETKNLDLMAKGGRAGFYTGGQSIPSEYTVEDARKTAMQDRLGGITDVMKRADLYRQGDIGQMYMAEGGLMDMGCMEKDYRQDGGFVPIGGKEKADDVPARLSKNEFVFTADAVRNAGGGYIDQGAEVMQNMMENLESGGQISEDSQGAQGMYNNMKQLETRTA